jgi:GDP-fucose transporter C1
MICREANEQSVVDGSPIALAYYNNILSSFALLPLIFLTGEGPAAVQVLSGDARRFLWGALITVCT